MKFFNVEIKRDYQAFLIQIINNNKMFYSEFKTIIQIQEKFGLIIEENHNLEPIYQGDLKTVKNACLSRLNHCLIRSLPYFEKIFSEFYSLLLTKLIKLFMES